MVKEHRIRLVKEESGNYGKEKIFNSASAVSIGRTYIEKNFSDREMFIALLLNTKNCINGIYTVAIGSINACVVHPREVFKSAILANSAAVVFLHNHPSGDSTPSREDKEMTKRLREAGEILGIRVMDHIIIGDDSHYSFADFGEL